jgi:glycosyltransferase involved in cell wall biosynthesis
MTSHASPNPGSVKSGGTHTSLRGVRILTDALDYERQQGTGIKNYTVGVLRALLELGADGALLSSKKLAFHPGLTTALLESSFTPQQSRRLRPGWFQQLFPSLSSALRVTKAVGSLRLEGYDRELALYSAPNCHARSAYLWNKRQTFSKYRCKDRIDLWHATLPLSMRVKARRSITTIHDLIPLTHASTNLTNPQHFYKQVEWAVQHNDALITNSEFTKKQLIQFFPSAAGKTFVTHLPSLLVPQTLSDKRRSHFLISTGLTAGRYFLFIANIEPKKNVARLLQAYAQISTDWPLVIVGKKAWLHEQELAPLKWMPPEISNRVRLLGYLPEDLLTHLYQGAGAFVFPSLCEGFGLPVLEALTFGLPVITSNVTALPEVCGEAARYVNPMEVESIAEAMEHIASDPAERVRLSALSRLRSQDFTWDRYVARLGAVYRQVL